MLPPGHGLVWSPVSYGDSNCDGCQYTNMYYYFNIVMSFYHFTWTILSALSSIPWFMIAIRHAQSFQNISGKIFRGKEISELFFISSIFHSSSSSSLRREDCWEHWEVPSSSSSQTGEIPQSKLSSISNQFSLGKVHTIHNTPQIWYKLPPARNLYLCPMTELVAEKVRMKLREQSSFILRGHRGVFTHKYLPRNTSKHDRK